MWLARLFPLTRGVLAAEIREALQDGGYASNVRDGAAVYLSAVLEQVYTAITLSHDVARCSQTSSDSGRRVTVQVTSRLLVRAGTGAPDAPVKADRRIDPKAIQKVRAGRSNR